MVPRSYGMVLSQKPTNELTSRIIGAAIEVHRELGPGLLESSYEDCLSLELEQAGIVFSRQPFLPIVYKGHKLHGCYRPDLIVDQMVIVEVKAIEKCLRALRASVTSDSAIGMRRGQLPAANFSFAFQRADNLYRHRTKKVELSPIRSSAEDQGSQ